MDLHDFLQVYFMINFWTSGLFIGGNLDEKASGYTVFIGILLLFFGLLVFSAFLIDTFYKEFKNKR